MSTETTNGITLPEFKAAETATWDETPIVELDGLVEEVVVNLSQDVPEVVPEKLAEPTPNPVDYVKRQRPKPKRPQQDDPDKYLLQAKAIVVQNYNEHRNPRRSPMLNMDLVYITTFTKTLNNWKAIVGSTVVRGLLWEVTFNGDRNEDGQPVNEAYVDIFQRIRHIRIPLGE